MRAIILALLFCSRRPVLGRQVTNCGQAGIKPGQAVMNSNLMMRNRLAVRTPDGSRFAGRVAGLQHQ